MSNKLIIKIIREIRKKPVFKLEKDFSINNIETLKSEIDEIVSKNT